MSRYLAWTRVSDPVRCLALGVLARAKQDFCDPRPRPAFEEVGPPKREWFDGVWCHFWCDAARINHGDYLKAVLDGRGAEDRI